MGVASGCGEQEQEVGVASGSGWNLWVWQVRYCIPYCQRKHGICQDGPLCQLEERHGVYLGQGYKNELACATFIDYIAQEERQGTSSFKDHAASEMHSCAMLLLKKQQVII